MKIIATILPDDVTGQPFQIRCLVPDCWLALTPAPGPSLEYAQGYAENHARGLKHAVVIEDTMVEDAP